MRASVVDVKGESGGITNWNFELGAIPVLLKQGWRKDSLKVGDQVTVDVPGQGWLEFSERAEGLSCPMDGECSADRRPPMPRNDPVPAVRTAFLVLSSARP